MRHLRSFARNNSGAAAAEMALMLPMLMTLLFGGMEGGHFFWREHQVVIAAREAARLASRLSFEQFDCTEGVSEAASGIVETLVQAKLGDTADVAITLVECEPDTATGLYADMAEGAPIVTVSVTMPYPSLFLNLGFDAGDLTLGASSQTAVMGL